MDLNNAIAISASGMRAQSTRIRVVAENIANADSLGTNKGEDPYRRKTILFKNALDRDINAELVKIGKIKFDKSPFKTVYEPHHPMADEKGYIQRPNVNSLIEMMDMREAQRSYEANLGTIDTSRSMIQRTIDLLR